mgnify:CR=1 FL=1
MRISTSLGSFVLLVTIFVHVAFAQTVGALPEVRMSDGIEFLTGGIGSDESAAIKKVQEKWPLTLLFAISSGGHAIYAADVAARITNLDGKLVFHTRSDGPFLLVRLAPGKYIVEAKNAGITASRNFEIVNSKSTSVKMIWPDQTGSLLGTR